MKYNCPNCNQSYEISPGEEDMDYECQSCGSRFTVPATDLKEYKKLSTIPAAKKLKTPPEAIVLNYLGLLMIAGPVLILLIGIDNAEARLLFPIIPASLIGGFCVCGLSIIIRGVSKTSQASEQMLELLRAIADRVNK